MSDTPKANAIIIQRGTYYLGTNTRDKDGNIKTKSEPRWEPDSKGDSIVICDFNTETHETIGTADLFPWWDSHGAQNRAWEKLGLARRNFPSPAEIYRWIKEWDGRGIDFCEICEGICAGYNCNVCPVDDIKQEDADE